MISSAAVAAPSFTGLRAPSCSTKAKLGSPIKVCFKDLGVVGAASAMLVGNAMAMEVLLPHNVVLEEEAAGGVEVQAKKPTRKEEGYSMWVDESFDCATQQGPDMDDAQQLKRKLVGRLMMPW